MESGDGRDTHVMESGLDICLLALVSRKESYGYELIIGLEAEGIRPVKEGGIYPMLRRMEREGLVSSWLSPSSEGPPRKYYRVSPKGREKLSRVRGVLQRSP